MSEGSLPAVLKTPTPLTRRRYKEVVLHVGQTCDVLYDLPTAQWLPSRIVELAGHLVRLQVVVPSAGLGIVEALTRLGEAQAALDAEAAADASVAKQPGHSLASPMIASRGEIHRPQQVAGAERGVSATTTTTISDRPPLPLPHHGHHLPLPPVACFQELWLTMGEVNRGASQC